METLNSARWSTDQDLITHLVSLFKNKRLEPTRCRMGITTDKDTKTYQLIKYNSRACIVGAILIGESVVENQLKDAADCIGVPVATMIGISLGFDIAEPMSPIGPNDARGLIIGESVAKQVFAYIKPRFTNFWP